MKKILGILFIAILLVSCGGNKHDNKTTTASVNTTSTATLTSSTTTSSAPVATTGTKATTSSTVEPTASATTSLDSTTTSSAVVTTTTATSTSVETTTTQQENKKCSLSEIISLGQSLNEDEMGQIVTFCATLVKKITDNNDHLFLFVDDNAYLNLRITGKLSDYLDNRYLNCKYNVEGIVTKHNGNVEVKYIDLSNETSTAKDVSYTNLTTNVSSIAGIYELMNDIKLSNKYNGIGKIVTFNGCVLSTDREDAQKKAVFYDNNNVITVISDSKICDANTGILNEYKVTGIISILKGQPAILLLDLEDVENNIVLDFTNVKEVSPSYFASYYHVSDKIRDPKYIDFSYLYKINGYVNIDDGRNGFYFGLTDNANGSLNDTGVSTSVKGVYLMNYQKQDRVTSYNEKIVEAYNNELNITCLASLYQFDTTNHAWKMFLYDASFTLNNN